LHRPAHGGNQVGHGDRNIWYFTVGTVGHSADNRAIYFFIVALEAKNNVATVISTVLPVEDKDFIISPH
jgi:hypothetical protein